MVFSGAGLIKRRFMHDKKLILEILEQIYGTPGSGRRTDDIMQELRGNL